MNNTNNMKMSHGEILDQLLKKRRISIPQLSDRTNIPKATLYSLRQRRGRNTNYEILLKISKELSVPIALFTDYSTEEIMLYFHFGAEEENCTSEDILALKTLLTENNLKANELSAILKALNYDSYNEDIIKSILNEEVPLNKGMYDLFMDIVLNKGVLLTNTELSLLEKIRKLPKDSKEIIEKLIDKLSDEDYYFNQLYYNDNNRKAMEKRLLSGDNE